MGALALLAALWPIVIGGLRDRRGLVPGAAVSLGIVVVAVMLAGAGARPSVAALDWQNRIAPAAQLVTTKYGVPGLKYAMDLNGYYGGIPRLPLIPIGPEAKKEIEQAFDGIKG